MKDRIENFIENLELKARRHDKVSEYYYSKNETEMYNLHLGHSKALRNTIEWLRIDFL